MKFYTVPFDGTSLDLDHLLAVGQVFENFNHTKPYLFLLTFAFNSTKLVSFDSPGEAEAARNYLVEAWQK